MPPRTNPESKWLKDLKYLLTTKDGIKILTFLIITLICIVLSVIYSLKRVAPQKIEVKNDHGTITIVLGDTKEFVFLLSPHGGDDDPWVRTGLMLKKNDRVRITASGRVNTAMKRVIAQTIKPELEKQAWASPRGLDQSGDESERLKNLNQYKVLPDVDNAKYGFGMLLAAIKDGSEHIPTNSIKSFPKNPRDEDLDFIAEKDGELVLTVNDIWLYENMKNAYIAPWDNNIAYYLQAAKFDASFRDEDLTYLTEALQTEVSKGIKPNSDSERLNKALREARKQYEKRVNDWKTIKGKHEDIWYKDNIGAFSVSITVKSGTMDT